MALCSHLCWCAAMQSYNQSLKIECDVQKWRCRLSKRYRRCRRRFMPDEVNDESTKEMLVRRPRFMLGDVDNDDISFVLQMVMMEMSVLSGELTTRKVCSLLICRWRWHQHAIEMSTMMTTSALGCWHSKWWYIDSRCRSRRWGRSALSWVVDFTFLCKRPTLN